jgi:cobalamin biosynthesis Mg chelatase CobN
MATRMLEAIQRGLWKTPSTDMQAGLQQIVLQAE